MPKYVKKPIVVEAVKLTCEMRADQSLWPKWMSEKWCADTPNAIWPKNWPDSDGSDPLAIHTLEGVLLADINDYIIKGIEGELYSCKPSIFEKTYERIAYED